MNKKLKKSISILLTVALIFSLFTSNRLMTTALAEEIPIYKNPNASVEMRVADLLSQMTLDEKIGQMIQGEIGSGEGNVKSDDTITYAIGSVFSGGGADPATGNDMQSWYNMVTAVVDASLKSRLGIPILYGVDAVHGNSNVIGATIFPHNIGLGAIGTADLNEAIRVVKRIGEATAKEMRITNITWNFSPCLANPQDPRWGRTYEGFGEDLNLVSKLGVAYVQGLQGETINDLKNPYKVVATVKHYVGEGYTFNGTNQGNVSSMTKEQIAAQILQPYIEAIAAGARTVMPSYSSIQGVKMHASKYLLTDILKVRLGFTGFIITDYNAIAQITVDEAGNTISDLKNQIRVAINAGNDMLMQPTNWKSCITKLRTLVLDELAVPGTGVTMQRINDAVSRILRVKFELGLFEKPITPNPAFNSNIAAEFGSSENRALAMEAVSKSMVLLKNDAINGVPILSQLRYMKNIFVAGKSADNIGNQCGGWTIQWQGSSGPITQGTTILQGIQNTITSEQKVTYSIDGTGAQGKDVAIVVIGEKPYAEGNGDNLNGLGFDATDLATLANIKAAGIPTIVVLISGRPMIVRDHIADWAGLIQAWLPGTEGKGVANVLFGDKDFVGKLPLKWSYYAEAYPLTSNNSQYVMFDKGYGLKKNQVTPITPVTAPSTSVTPGFYNTDQNIRLTSTISGARIYYTTDGSNPTVFSSLYTLPIVVKESTVIKAITVTSSIEISSVGVFNYVIEKVMPEYKIFANGNILIEGGSLVDSSPLTFQVSDNLSGVKYAKINISGKDYIITDPQKNPSIIINLAGIVGNQTATITVIDLAGNKVETSFRFTVTANVSNMKQLLNDYSKSGVLKNPLLKQLTNSLNQAEHQLSLSRPDKAVKHMEDFIKHLNKKPMERCIQAGAKTTLNNEANALINLWLNKKK